MKTLSEQFLLATATINDFIQKAIYCVALQVFKIIQGEERRRPPTGSVMQTKKKPSTRTPDTRRLVARRRPSPRRTQAKEMAQLLERAQKGEAEAQFLLARYYAKGLEDQDKKEAQQWYFAAAQQDHPMALYKYGKLINMRQDGAKAAFPWFLKAAHHQVRSAQHQVGLFYLKGWGVAQDRQEAVRWFRAAAEGGHLLAQYKLASCLTRGERVDKADREEAFKWYLTAARQGHAKAQYNAGMCYKRGEGVEVQWEQAVAWFRAATEKEYTKAEYELAKCLFKGRGVEKDTEQSLKYLKRLARMDEEGCYCELKDIPAAYKLARYLEGTALQTRDDRALMSAARWYCFSLCGENFHKAKAWLGEQASNIVGKAYEPALKAMFWHLKAVRAGDAASQCRLAVALALGPPFYKRSNQEEADKWFLAAATQSHAEAQYFCGLRLAAQGKKEEALGWFLASAQQGFAKAQYQAAIRLFRTDNTKEETRVCEQQGIELCKQAAKARYPPALLWMANHFRDNGQSLKARKCLRCILEEQESPAVRRRVTETRHKLARVNSSARRRHANDRCGVRRYAEVMLQRMNRNNEGLPMRSLVELCQTALAKDVRDKWQQGIKRMKDALPSEVWQGLVPQLPKLVQGDEVVEEEEQLDWGSLQHMEEDAQEALQDATADRLIDEAEDEAESEDDDDSLS
ncbi:Sel1 domain protein repeat-containing protein [Balamuthia mandrillaris]